jgi:hypothetical protein
MLAADFEGTSADGLLVVSSGFCNGFNGWVIGGKKMMWVGLREAKPNTKKP